MNHQLHATNAALGMLFKSLEEGFGKKDIKIDGICRECGKPCTKAPEDGLSECCTSEVLRWPENEK